MNIWVWMFVSFFRFQLGNSFGNIWVWIFASFFSDYTFAFNEAIHSGMYGSGFLFLFFSDYIFAFN